MKFQVLDSLFHNQKMYAPGDTVDLPTELGQSLTANGIVTPIPETLEPEADPKSKTQNPKSKKEPADEQN